MNPHPPSPLRTDSAQGFTLVELLVCIGVLAILASLLLPALTSARRTAHRSQCLANTRQLLIATHLYWDDHDGCTFRYLSNTPTNSGQIYWFGWIGSGPEGQRAFDPSPGTLSAYLGSTVDRIGLCPSLRSISPSFKLKANQTTWQYGYNLHLSSPSGSQPCKPLQSRNPQNLAIYADSAQVNTFQPPASTANPLLEEFYYINQSEPTTHFRHQAQAITGFADSHAALLRPEPRSLDSRLPGQDLGHLPPSLLLPE